MALTIGIVGLPNAGKSTLFNALTKNDVLAANYPFATIEPNVGVVGVPDDRLPQLAEVFGSAKVLPATVEFVDIAGIVAGASQGEGLGNKFLSHIRESAAICQVTRVFRDEDVTHVDGEVNPANDISTIQTELILADLQTVEKAIPRLEKEARGNKAMNANLDAAREALAALEAGTPIIATKIDRTLIRELSLLTAKPFIYVFNCDADELADEALKAKMQELVAPAEAIFLDAKFEAELVELGDDDEARAMLAEMGVDEPGLDVLARVGFDTLGLQTYLTAGPKETRAWTIPKGATAPEAAGVIHTDFQRGFIKAEVVSFDDLIEPRLHAEGQGGRQGPHGGQGLRHGRRRRGGVPVQCVVANVPPAARRSAFRRSSGGVSRTSPHRDPRQRGRPQAAAPARRLPGGVRLLGADLPRPARIRWDAAAGRGRRSPGARGLAGRDRARPSRRTAVRVAGQLARRPPCLRSAIPRAGARPRPTSPVVTRALAAVSRPDQHWAAFDVTANVAPTADREGPPASRRPLCLSHGLVSATSHCLRESVPRTQARQGRLARRYFLGRTEATAGAGVEDQR